MLADIRRWGEFGMIPALNARRAPRTGIAIIDDDGEITFGELDDAAHAVANGLLRQGGQGRRRRRAADPQPPVVPGRRCTARPGSGARIILLNSEFSGPQIKEVSEREGAQGHHLRRRVHRRGVAGRTGAGQAAGTGHQPRQGRALGVSTDDTLADLIARSSKQPAPKVTKHSSVIILTSGTTGTPKGANRSTPPSLAPIGGVLSHVPFKSGEVTSLPAPMFHALGSCTPPSR